MALEKTFAIIKPDAVRAGNAGKIIDRIEAEGFRIAAMKKLHMTRDQAAGFYHVHAERPFFGDLLAFMTSGPCVVMILEADNAIKGWRDLMGPTNSKEAGPNTIRGQFGTDIECNASHGSDAPETAAFETSYFFNAFERV